MALGAQAGVAGTSIRRRQIMIKVIRATLTTAGRA
jgi:hypothetical protein